MYQQSFEIHTPGRGLHTITASVCGAVDTSDVDIGLCNIFVHHTSASLLIQENADPDVLTDLRMAFDQLSPENWPWTHTCEGPDDMPAHVKTSLTDSSVNIPVKDGRLLTGTWQGIYLCEHRNHGGNRQLVVTLQGETVSPE